MKRKLETLCRPTLDVLLESVYKKRCINKNDIDRIRAASKDVAVKYADIKLAEHQTGKAFDFETFYKENKDEISKDLYEMIDKFGLEPEVIFSRKRVRELALPRQVLCYMIAEKHGYIEAVYKSIGRIMKKDRGTVRHGANTVKDVVEIKDKKTLSYISILEE